MLKRYSLILIIFFTVIILLLLTASFIYQTKQGASNELPSFIKQPSLTANKPTNSADNLGQEPLLQLPLSQALERITKKPFGLKISPQNSPVAPEKFSGLHAVKDLLHRGMQAVLREGFFQTDKSIGDFHVFDLFFY